MNNAKLSNIGPSDGNRVVRKRQRHARANRRTHVRHAGAVHVIADGLGRAELGAIGIVIGRAVEIYRAGYVLEIAGYTPGARAAAQRVLIAQAAHVVLCLVVGADIAAVVEAIGHLDAGRDAMLETTRRILHA